jgi:hypothetical protein
MKHIYSEQTYFEYMTFELADYKNFPALRLQKLIDDRALYTFAPRYHTYFDNLINEMMAKFTKEELTVTEQMCKDFYTQMIGNELGIELLIAGKASKETMMKAVALGDNDFDRAVALSVKIGNALNLQVKEIEQQNKSSNHTTL